MQTTWNIASATRPINWTAFVDLIKSSAAEHGKVTALGMLVVPGPGCANYGILLEGEEVDAQRFVECLTIALQPAKYSQCGPDSRLTAGIWSNELEGY